MANIQAARGFPDILPADSWKWHVVEQVARATAALFNFHEIRTPILEPSELFHRGVGETTDIVSKETFSFPAKDGESLTLRPEGTAGVVRAMIEHNLLSQEGARQKVYYIGPNFRYEKPQKGRYRQHHQFGAEAFGIAAPEQDVECILLQMDFYRRAGLKGTSLRLNSLGDAESKARYRDLLLAHLSPQKDRLSKESQSRLERNPLRILDSKDPADIAACEGAPSAASALSDKSRAHFDRVLALLEAAAIPFTRDGTLVRGFDYYTETLWEVTAEGLGAQSAVGGGGRYDNLVALLGGRPTPGVGFGSGLERLLIALEAQGTALARPFVGLVYVAAQSDAARPVVQQLAIDLRRANIPADLDLAGRSIKAQFKEAEKIGATVTITIGDNELTSNTVAVKVMATRQQVTIPRDQLFSHLKAARSEISVVAPQ